VAGSACRQPSCHPSANEVTPRMREAYWGRQLSRAGPSAGRAPQFHPFIGSGVAEAGCKTAIGSRCKQSGMYWGVTGAENILAFRCIHASRRLDAFWKWRLNRHVSLNDAIPLAA